MPEQSKFGLSSNLSSKRASNEIVALNGDTNYNSPRQMLL